MESIRLNEELRMRIEQAVGYLIKIGAKEIYLFGSMAHGRDRDNSDIDLAVSGIPPEKFFKVLGEVGDILRHPFDLIDLDETNSFTRYLREEGELRRVG
ncbi:MAG: nucleotidyltransferase domain-containing protein [Candidatus Eremiobacteraeota bacterium]|nr:nucleotidyltransferase domain-containing protein [Candidatus Eremiobacteraeota bacterium]